MIFGFSIFSKNISLLSKRRTETLKTPHLLLLASHLIPALTIIRCSLLGPALNGTAVPRELFLRFLSVLCYSLLRNLLQVQLHDTLDWHRNSQHIPVHTKIIVKGSPFLPFLPFLNLCHNSDYIHT